MRQFPLRDLLYNMSRSEMYSHYPQAGFWNETRKQELLTMLSEVERCCKESGLDSEDPVRETKQRIADGKVELEQLGRTLSVLRNHICFEIKSFRYFEIDRVSARHWDNIRAFGDDVYKHFPSARDDIEEASKCLALDRGTACVMHLSRALELAMRELALRIRGKFKESDDWDPILKEIDTIVNGWPNQTTAEVEKKDKYRQIHVALTSVKRAWRHPAMHSRFAATPEVALDIYQATGGFFRQMAEVM